MANFKRILMISGRQGSGKTSNANLIYEALKNLGYYPEIIKFAGPLYTMHDLCLPVLKRLGVRDMRMHKDGELLQVLGTEFGRKCIGENVWVDVCRREADFILRQNPDRAIVIIDDMRFENEFDAFPDAYRIHLECDKQIRKTRASYWRENDLHPSETGLDDYLVRGKFDLRINTEHTSKEHVSHLIRVEWMNNRTYKHSERKTDEATTT